MTSLVDERLFARARTGRRAPRPSRSRTALLLVSSWCSLPRFGAVPISLASTLRALIRGLEGRGATLEGVEAIAWNLRFRGWSWLPWWVRASACRAHRCRVCSAIRSPSLTCSACQRSVARSDAGPFARRKARHGVGDTPFAAGGSSGAVPLFAFLGALGAVAATLALSRAGPRTSMTSLLLAGVVVGRVLTSLSTYVMLRDVDRLRAVFTWTHGGNLASSSWGDVGRALPYALSGACVLYALARGLDCASAR